MHTGMLWFDNSKAPLANKIKKAIEYYEKKYGAPPNICLVHPGDLDIAIGLGEKNVEGFAVRPYRPVPPSHIWIGIEDE